MSIPPASRFASRLARAREALRTEQIDALVVTHLPNVRYLTGFSGSAGVLVVGEVGCWMVADFRYVTAVRSLLGADPELADLVSLVVPEHTYDETLLRVLDDSGARRIGVEAAWMPVSRFNTLSRALASRSAAGFGGSGASPALVPTERVIEAARSIKDSSEIATLRDAGRRLASVVASAVAAAAAGRSELEVAFEIDGLLRTAGFERPAFETIVASGPNSALPHARPGRRVLREGDGVVLDFGGVYDGYCVDLTRTVELGRWPSELRRMFDAVREAQAAAIGTVRPGATTSEVDAAARDVLARHGLADAFGHGTGHGLGLEVHEDPKISRPAPGRPDTTIEAGMVFTIEPGAYVEHLGGVRIEDDVLVTAGGCEVLTREPR